jgi:GNAT superfamily N-acetyltransferase
MLPDGLWDVPPGKLAAVVTHLQMYQRPAPRPVPPVAADLVAHDRPDPAWYRALFTRVGRDWLWFSRLGLDDAALGGILHDPDVQVFSLRQGGQDLGLLELDFRVAGACELAYFGLAAQLQGQGAGRWLMERALDVAWAAPITRFHVHTCSLDSPAALAFYIRSGFTPYARQVEVADDPRLTGALPRDAAPQVPIL